MFAAFLFETANGWIERKAEIMPSSLEYYERSGYFSVCSELLGDHVRPGHGGISEYFLP